MNVDAIFQALNDEGVDYIVFGGINFLLNHAPILTFDVDIWIADTDPNRDRLNRALVKMGAEWGPTERDYKPVSDDSAWLKRQNVFCLTSHYGAIDVFRQVRGHEDKYVECKRRALKRKTDGGVHYRSMSDADMLECQAALGPGDQKPERIKILKEALVKARNGKKRKTRK